MTRDNEEEFQTEGVVLMDRQQVEERICQIIVMEVVYITSLTFRIYLPLGKNSAQPPVRSDMSVSSKSMNALELLRPILQVEPPERHSPIQQLRTSSIERPPLGKLTDDLLDKVHLLSAYDFLAHKCYSMAPHWFTHV